MPATQVTVNSTSWLEVTDSVKSRIFYTTPNNIDNEIYITVGSTTPTGNPAIIAILDKDNRELVLDSLPAGEKVYGKCRQYADKVSVLALV